MRKSILAAAILMTILTGCGRYGITGLQTEYQDCPLGTDVAQPRFSWQMASQARGACQTACRILVSTAPDEFSESLVYDSGRVETDLSVGFAYAGEPLKARTRYYWKVQVWNEKGRMAESDVRWFETGLMGEGWDGAQWIGSSIPHFSKYRSLYDISFDIEIERDSEHGTFVFGRRGDRYVIADIEKGGRLTISHVDGDKTVLDGELRFRPHSGPYHVNLDVKPSDYAKVYRTHVTVDGVKTKDRIESRFDPDDAWQPYCRLYEVGYCQPAGQNALISGITIHGSQWDSIFWSDDSQIREEGDAGLVTWSPAEESGAPMLRKTIQTRADLVSARLYTTARGIYEYYINGERLGKDYFNPGSTDYRFRIMYSSYDITPYLAEGRNAVCAQLGGGWWCDFNGCATSWQDQYGTQLSLLAKIVLTYADGTSETVVSDDSWRVFDGGPITSDSFQNGEDYDARREVDGWSEPEFDDSLWANASVYDAPADSVAISHYVGNAVRNHITLRAKSVTEPEAGVFVYDMGQNMVGIPRVRLYGEAGREVTFHYGEMIFPEEIPADPIPPLTREDYEARRGQVYNQNYRSALVTDHYILKGDPEGEYFQPHFTFHGFRYIEIRGLDAALPLDAVEGLVLDSVGEQKSSYSTGNQDINRLFSNIVWGQRGNFLSIPTDCPQRDERFGWTGDAQVFARSATYNMDVDQFYTRWFNTLRDCQGDDGRYSDFVPWIGSAPAGAPKGRGHMGWMEAGIIIPWQLYLQYGDTRFIEEHWESMNRYMDGLVARAENFIQPPGVYGDWLGLETTDQRLSNTAYFAYDASLMARMARAIGRADDAVRYEQLFRDIQEAFLSEGFEFNTQTSIVLPLQAGLFGDDVRGGMADRLVDNIRSHGYTLTTGFIGTPYLNLVLSDNGHSDIAFRLFEQTAYPSWLYPVLQGATTVWERWNSYTIARGFGDVEMNSFNHYSYGAIEEWMMTRSLGIQVDPEKPGYKHIILQPEYSPSLGTVSGHYDSVYGRISGTLKKAAGGFKYSVTIPANTTATICLPDGPKELASGHHTFVIKNNEQQ